MKHAPLFIQSDRYHYVKWRMHCARLILALAGLSNAIVWGIVAAFYGSTTIAVWLSGAALVLLALCVVKMRDVNRHHDLYMQALLYHKAMRNRYLNQPPTPTE